MLRCAWWRQKLHNDENGNKTSDKQRWSVFQFWNSNENEYRMYMKFGMEWHKSKKEERGKMCITDMFGKTSP